MAFRSGGLKRLAKKALVRSSVLTLASRAARSSAAILMYHSVIHGADPKNDIFGLSKSSAVFEAHMRALAQYFAPVSIEEVVEFAKTGKRLPARAVAVTFDDGFADNYDVALPILTQYGIPAAFYIMVNAVATGKLPWYCQLRLMFNETTKCEWRDPERHHRYRLADQPDREKAFNVALEIGAIKTGNVQDQYLRETEETLGLQGLGTQHSVMMDWDKVRALRKAGHVIGGHTLSHPNLAHVSAAEARTEMFGCKQVLERELGEPIVHFSYPHPALNPQWSVQTSQLAREAGFESAVLTTCGPVRAGDEPLALTRIYAPNEMDQWLWNLQSTFLGRAV